MQRTAPGLSTFNLKLVNEGARTRTSTISRGDGPGVSRGSGDPGIA